MKRGGCSFATKIQLATRLGAKSIIIIDNTDYSTPVMMNTIGKSQTNILPGPYERTLIPYGRSDVIASNLHVDHWRTA